MGEKRIEIVTESMFYTLMAFMKKDCSGTDAAAFAGQISGGRVHLGPATIYTVLGRFEKEGILKEIRREGRKRIYTLTEKGRIMYENEYRRMEACLNDAHK